MTRLFSAIFVAYIALVSLQPCDEMLSRAVGIDERAASVLASENPESEDPDCQECSPFCICSCCKVNAAFSYSLRSFQDEIAEFAASQIKPEYENADFRGHSNSIWQPPKA